MTLVIQEGLTANTRRFSRRFAPITVTRNR